MALDLFVNYERSSNNSLFYRVTSTSPYTITLKLSDLESPTDKIGDRYDAKLSINNGPVLQMVPTSSGDLITQIPLDTRVPCVCAFTTYLYIGSEITKTFTISGAFLSYIPAIDFIAYPNTYIDPQTKTQKKLSETNFTDSPGVYFYGEGHTENITLSASQVEITDNLTWTVGTSANSTIKPLNYCTATASVSSLPGEEESLMISVRLNNNEFLSTGPIYQYNDTTGKKEYYPFFASTVSIDGVVANGKLKSNLRILPYPEPIAPSLVSPFNLSHFTLPTTFEPVTFTGYITNTNRAGEINQNLNATQWEVQTTHDTGSVIYERTDTSAPLSSIVGFQFQLAYDQPPEELILPYYLNANYQSTVTLTVTSFAELVLNYPPYDWIPRPVTFVNSTSAVVTPIISIKPYISNFYNTVNEPVTISLAELPIFPLELQKVTFYSPLATNELTLSSSSLSGEMIFETLGTVNLSAVAVIKNTQTNETQTYGVNLNNVIEVLDKLDDDPNEEYYNDKSLLNSSAFNENNYPKLSPNEWATADNVNYIINELQSKVEVLNKFTKMYGPKGMLYGWFGSSLMQPGYVWQDLECPNSFLESPTWEYFECGVTTLTANWGYHECIAYPDPSCLQKHCLSWKWKERKLDASTVNVTWKQTKRGADYVKKWAFERCQTDSIAINCPRNSWKISTIDPAYFPITSYDSPLRCNIVGFNIHPKTNQLIVAYDTEIELAHNDYQSTRITRIGTADELFPFQNIVAMDVTSDGKVIAADSVLSRIAVFGLIDNSFVRYTSWGKVGRESENGGLLTIKDIHVDQEDHILVVDSGNQVIKRFTINGKETFSFVQTFLLGEPISVCVDSQKHMHVLSNGDNNVYVFDYEGALILSYNLGEDIVNPTKVNTSYNREMIYVTHSTGVTKFFRNGKKCYDVINNLVDERGAAITNYRDVVQDKYRNLYVCTEDKVLKHPDLQKIIDQKSLVPQEYYWSSSDLKIHKEEYIQPWVYLKSFHRLWDNIELTRNSLIYETSGCKVYQKPVYDKLDLIIGQNEIVTNSVINRLSQQLWANILTLKKYFDSKC